MDAYPAYSARDACLPLQQNAVKDPWAENEAFFSLGN
jgi:hypothetical protein